MVDIASTPSRTVNWLKQDHQRLFSLMDDFRAIPKSDHEKRNAQVDAIIRNTAKHASCEEQVIYPLLRDRLDNGKIIYERNVTDDTINKEVLELLLQMDSKRDGDLYDRTTEKFHTIENDHLTEEELWLDQLAHKLVESGDDEATYEKMIAAYNHAPTYPHATLWARMHTYALGAKLAHPIVGRVDQLYDSMKGERPADKVAAQYPPATA